MNGRTGATVSSRQLAMIPINPRLVAEEPSMKSRQWDEGQGGQLLGDGILVVKSHVSEHSWTTLNFTDYVESFLVFHAPFD